MKKSDELITMWSAAVAREQGPYVVEQDKAAAPKLFEKAIQRSASDWLDHGSFFTMDKNDRTTIHVNLIPEPYAGDIRNAPVVILMKNPGFDDHVYWEHEQPKYRRVMFANIRQDFRDGRPPFFSLRPEFHHMGNFRYFGSRFADLVLKVRDDCGKLSTQQALELVARTVCVVQMTGYTSKDSPPLDDLPSARLVRDWVHEEVLPAVGPNGRSLLVMRAVDEWLRGADRDVLKERHGQDVYIKDRHMRTPRFSPESEQGKIIRRRVKEVWMKMKERRAET